MLPSASELKYFVEVANTSNLSRAAERLGISQPTLSLAIQRLEHGLGTSLLIRTRSGVKLTHTGHKLLNQARSLLREWERIREDALRDQVEARGTYVIGCHPSVALFSLPWILPQLLVKYPQLEIKVHHDLSRKVTEDVISFKVDFGIVVNPWNHPDLIIKKLYQDEVVLWTREDPTPLQDTESGKGVLICDPELIQSQSILKQLEKKGLKFERFLNSSNLEVITSLVSAGAGVGILPTRVAQRIPSLGLKAVGKAFPKFHDQIALIYRADAHKAKASRELAQFIEAALKEDPSSAQ